MTDERHPPSLLALAGGGHVAYRFVPGRYPTVVFLCGYGSDMSGTKARFLHHLCGEAGHAYLCFGYRDEDVPWQTSLLLAARLRSSDVTVEIVSDGDHRLTRDVDLARLARTLHGVLDGSGA